MRTHLGRVQFVNNRRRSAINFEMNFVLSIIFVFSFFCLWQVSASEKIISSSNSRFCFTDPSMKSVRLVCENETQLEPICQSLNFQQQMWNEMMMKYEVIKLNTGGCTSETSQMDFCEIFENLRVLDISGYGMLIQSVNCKFFLEVFNASRNQIVKIPDGFFDQSPNLVEIVLAHNSIEELKDVTFYGLRRLKKVDLSFNSIAAIDENLFASNKQLEEVHIQHNRIKSFNCRNWPNTIKVLDASYNDVYSAEAVCLMKLKELMEQNAFIDIGYMTPDVTPKSSVLGSNGNQIPSENVDEFSNDFANEKNHRTQIDKLQEQIETVQENIRRLNFNNVVTIIAVSFVAILSVILMFATHFMTKKNPKIKGLEYHAVK